MKRLFFIACLLLALAPATARADYYRYANAEGEYALSLPDAPLGETIWAQDGKVPYLENAPKYGAIGEYAVIKRVDPETSDLFDVRITFVKADRDFLLGLKETKIKETLAKLFKDTHLENGKFNFSQGTDTLKWGTYSGFSISQNNDILYNVAHYLAGESSIMTVKVVYSAQNPAFSQYYKDFAKSITYMGK